MRPGIHDAFATMRNSVKFAEESLIEAELRGTSPESKAALVDRAAFHLRGLEENSKRIRDELLQEIARISRIRLEAVE